MSTKLINMIKYLPIILKKIYIYIYIYVFAKSTIPNLIIKLRKLKPYLISMLKKIVL